MLELRVCSLGFLSVASSAAADADEATPATIFPFAAPPPPRRSLLLAAAAAVVAREECVVVAVVVDVDVVDDVVDVDELLELLLLPLLLLLLELLLPLWLSLLLLLLAELPPSPVLASVVVVELDFDCSLLLSESELVDESSVGGNFGFGLPY